MTTTEPESASSRLPEPRARSVRARSIARCSACSATPCTCESIDSTSVSPGTGSVVRCVPATEPVRSTSSSVTPSRPRSGCSYVASTPARPTSAVAATPSYSGSSVSSGLIGPR